jgi:hypothetical protein
VKITTQSNGSPICQYTYSLACNSRMIGRNLKKNILLKENMFGKRETKIVWRVKQLIWV